MAYDSKRKLGRIELIDNIEKAIEKRRLGPDVLATDDFAAFRDAICERSSPAGVTGMGVPGAGDR